MTSPGCMTIAIPGQNAYILKYAFYPGVGILSFFVCLFTIKFACEQGYLNSKTTNIEMYPDKRS